MNPESAGLDGYTVISQTPQFAPNYDQEDFGKVETNQKSLRQRFNNSMDRERYDNISERIKILDKDDDPRSSPELFKMYNEAPSTKRNKNGYEKVNSQDLPI